MNYSGIIKNDPSNGEGMRLTLFVSGCNHKCKGCFNKDTWDFEYGKRFTLKTRTDLLIYFEDNSDYLDGISILGGEPLDKANINYVLNYIKVFKSMYPEKTVWIWTGFAYEQLFEMYGNKFFYGSLFEFVDILVDGRFVEELKDSKLKYRGSSNQRVIDIKKTLECNGEIQLYTV